MQLKLDGELIAELLDQGEYPSNIDNVAAVSTQQLCLLRRAKHELVPFKLEYLDIGDCRAIEYRKETACYRIILGVACFIGVLLPLYMLITDPDGFSAASGPLVVAIIGLVTFGIRFITSTHRHIVRFELPDETLTWRSPAIDFDSKAGAAHAVRDYARERGILRKIPHKIISADPSVTRHCRVQP